MAKWLESRICNWKVASSSLGPVGIVGGGSECTALSPHSIPRLRCPWARNRTLNCSPDATAIWLPTAPGVCSLLQVCVHCSRCVFTAPGVCSLLQVCVHCSRCVSTAVCVCTLDGLIVEHKFWVWVTILSHMSRHFITNAWRLFLHITARSNPCLILTKHHLIQMST